MFKKFFGAIALSLIACSAYAQTPIPRAKLTSPDVYKFVETGYFSNMIGANGKYCTEYTSGAYQQSIIIDEARIVKVEGNEMFFELILRQHTSNDQPITQMKTKVNGDRVYPLDEVVSAKDYEYESERVVASFENISINGVSTIEKREKEDRIYRVIERKITFSHVFAKGIPKKVKIYITNGGSQIDFLNTVFSWKIVD